VETHSRAGGRELLADLNGNIALAVVSVDTPSGPDTSLIERLRERGIPVLAFGLEESTDTLTSALEAGANDAISLGAPMSHLIDKAEQLVSSSARQHVSKNKELKC
jgi:DNA-binding NarL/FixJ family response regulator